VTTTTATTAIDVEHHVALVNGIRIHYAKAGQGDPAVLLHGFAQTGHGSYPNPPSGP
jgi:pimeloyl-ACP methyl ester carboxylesterase